MKNPISKINTTLEGLNSRLDETLDQISDFLKDLFYLFLDRGEGREKERESNINVWLPLTHSLLGTWPTRAKSVIFEDKIKKKKEQN